MDLAPHGGKPSRPTFPEINERNRVFRRELAIQTLRRMADEGIYRAAFDEMYSEAVRGVPVYFRRPWELLLEEAERRVSRQMSLNGKKGGKCKDRLQFLIERLVAKNPAIDCNRLRREIANQKGDGIVFDVTDALITFENAQGKQVDAKISGLKDRLSRAKKEIIAKAAKSD